MHTRGSMPRCACPTKRQMHSAQSIKMQMSFIRGGNICVGRESVFRLSVGPIHPCGIRAWVYTRHPGSAVVDPAGRLRWDEPSKEMPWNLRHSLSVKSLFYDRFGVSMATAKTGSASRFSGWNVIDLNWYQSSKSWVRRREYPQFYVARKADKLNPISFKYLGLPLVCRFRENGLYS